MSCHAIIIILAIFIGSCSEKVFEAPQDLFSKIHPGKTTSTVRASKPMFEPLEYSVDDEFMPYDYDTLLTGGYHLSYSVYKDSIHNENMQRLTLMKKNKPITILNEISNGLLFKNLGYIGADFGDSFVFVQSFGSGNPHEIQLIKKSNGDKLRVGCWIDADENEQVLLYIKEIHSENNELILYDIKSGRETVINEFKSCFCANKYAEGIRDCLKIDTITPTEIVLTVENQDEKIVKSYPR